MISIEVKRSSRLEDIEGYLQQLDAAKKVNFSVNVVLPKNLSNSYFGLVPSLMQFVVTWLRYKKATRLILDIDDFSEDGIMELYKNELIYPMVILAWNRTGVYSINGENLRSALKPGNRLYSERMMMGRTVPGNKLLLTDFDHLSDDRLLPCFGSKYQFVATKTQLKTSLAKGLKEVFVLRQDLPPAFDDERDRFINIIYELMKNTFEWGKEDGKNVPLDPNIRGTLIKFVRKKRDSLLDEYKGHKGLKSFFGSSKLKENATGELYLMELSVFDGGVGFKEKFCSVNPETSDWSEIDIIKKCLTKHATSAKGLNKGEKGLGLDEILNIIDGRGLIRIKTGHSCVYRNMITHRHQEENQDMTLYDWKSHDDKKFTTFREIEGAVITIVYPIEFSDF